MATVSLSGVIPALLTPFDEAERIDPDALRALTRYAIDGGVSALFVNGSTGSFPLLTPDETLETVECVVAAANGARPVLAGIGHCSTRGAIALAEDAASAGADMVVLCTPYYFPCSDTELREHFLAVCDASPLPVALYNIPQITGNTLSVDLTAELARHDNCVAIKDSSGDMTHLLALIDRTRHLGTFAVLQGSEPLAAASVLSGAAGAVCGSANVAPRLAVSVCEAAAARDIPQAMERQAAFSRLRGFYAAGTPRRVMGVCLEMMGICNGGQRRPYLEPDEAGRALIRRHLEEAGLL